MFAKFSHLLVFNAPAEGFPLEFCNGGLVKKLEWHPYQIVKRYDDVYICLDTVPALDGQTDRQNWLNNIAICMHCMLTLDKNESVEEAVAQLAQCRTNERSDMVDICFIAGLFNWYRIISWSVNLIFATVTLYKPPIKLYLKCWLCAYVEEDKNCMDESERTLLRRRKQYIAESIELSDELLAKMRQHGLLGDENIAMLHVRFIGIRTKCHCDKKSTCDKKPATIGN